MVVVAVRPEHDELLLDEEARCPVTELLRHLGQRHADRPDLLFEPTYDQGPTIQALITLLMASHPYGGAGRPPRAGFGYPLP